MTGARVLAAGIFVLLLLLSPLFGATVLPIRVIHLGGSLHGFLVLKDERGEVLADGEFVQFVNGPDRIKSEQTFHFRDGSLQQEITIYSQRRYFRLLSDHLIQKGPAFRKQMDLYVNAATGDVTVRYSEGREPEKVIKEHINLPVNLANGLVATMLQNIPASQPAVALAIVVATPKPRIVKLDIRAEGEDTFSVGETRCKAVRYLGKFDIGGVAGVVAGIAGKQPPDSHFWLIPGPPPLFVKSLSPQFDGGPLWEIDLVSPTGPKSNGAGSDGK